MRNVTRRSAIVTLVCAGAALAAGASPATAAPDIVATIAPIHSLVAGVMEGIGTPTLLLPPNASPHSYALRPSDAKALNDAEIVFWIGEELETFMQRPLRALATDARIIGLAKAEGMTLLPVRAASSFEAPEEGSGQQRAALDPHIWLSPANARRIVDTVVTTLSDIDPTNAARYRANGDRTRQRLRDLSAQLTRQLAPLRGRPYIVFHDAYQYFERAYGLRPVGAITINPGQPASAGRLAELRDKITRLETGCLFSEPQFKPDIVDALRRGLDTRIGILDSLGSKFAAGPDQYFETMRDLGRSYAQCLATNPTLNTQP